MTFDEIRQLDGPALAFLAWELGLAPQEIQGPFPSNKGDKLFLVPALYTNARVGWIPYERLDQAHAVFCQLRKQHWDTLYSWNSEKGYGQILVMGHGKTLTRFWGEGRPHVPHDAPTLRLLHEDSDIFPSEASEAMALLRLACLAVASTAETEYA